MGVIRKDAASKTVYNDVSVYTPSSSSGSSSSNVVSVGVSPSRTSTTKPTMTTSSRTSSYYDKLDDLEDDEPDYYFPSSTVNSYYSKMQEVENSKPADYESKYTQNISDLLNTIQNPESFDLSTNDTYQQLYNNYKESYMAQGSRAMRDAMGSAAGLTGGYGSTYATAAGQQAYDNYLQQLNDQNLSIAQMALDDYWNNRNDKYNQLSAVQSADNTDYSRYRDDVSDWQTDRAYYANQYQNMYNNDYGEYRDTVSDYQTDRAYYANQAQNSYSNDYNMYTTGLSQYNTEQQLAQQAEQYAETMAYNQAKDAQEQANWQAQFDYQKAQDAIANALKAKSSGDSGSEKSSTGTKTKGQVDREIKQALGADNTAEAYNIVYEEAIKNGYSEEAARQEATNAAIGWAQNYNISWGNVYGGK